MARRPAALPAQVEPPPDWTVLVILHALAASPKLQGAGGRECGQILEVRGQAVLTCGGEGRGIVSTLDWCIVPPLTRCCKTCCATNGFISGTVKRRLEKWRYIYDISCVVYLIYTSVAA